MAIERSLEDAGFHTSGGRARVGQVSSDGSQFPAATEREGGRMRRLGNLLVFTLVVAMAAASSALAAGPAQTSYGGNAGNVQGSLAGTASPGQLPFTGANIAAIAVAG